MSLAPVAGLGHDSPNYINNPGHYTLMREASAFFGDRVPAGAAPE